MAQRDTGTGIVLENMVIPSLCKGQYHFCKGIFINHRPGGGRQKIDVLAWKDKDNLFLISLKWQQSSGTAEQKIPFEIISLAEAIFTLG